jgi:hypothetical protein
MSDELFKQSLVWALAVEEEEERNLKIESAKSKTNQEVVTLDYDFLDSEDF